MKFKYYISAVLLVTSMMFSSCEEQLNEDVFSQLDPGTLFNSANGVERVLFGAYRDAQITDNFGGNIWFQEEWTCDHFWETGGAVNLQATVMLAFTWDASYPTHWTGLWNNCYYSVRNCNLVLENIDQSPIDDATKERLVAEARFVRASAYYILYTMWGPVPLRFSTTGDLAMARATDAEMQTFLEKEFSDVSSVLPARDTPGYQYGRATRGAALGYLTKFYLNTKQWQKCADAAKDLMDLNEYELWPDYTTLFTVDNETRQKEFVWVYPCSTQGPGNEFMNGAFPPQFKSTVDGSIVFKENMRNWARMDRVQDSFYNSFDPADERRELIISEYINTAGKTVSLLNNNNTRSFKYVPDPDAVGNSHGNDIAVIRYADILLSRAEALNELNGPTQEALDLIQEIRDRAGLTTPLVLGDYTKESLRDRILDERGWELYAEKVRRQDLLRHGKFVSSAKARGIAIADEHHKLFPIPQTEINANPLCEQNSGY
ncbi:RagB/SusD family nutrient uptake outer membrane protein [uncultured Sunxiuqinia sp.]|uniref:RagB/SusD family nutrient uptake outer membrane protein n=1 Tax=uncultured Sunxiuqinia sp. TaxID=1573825 RepID=UPI0030DCC3D1|tara:strand:+ start:4463 stop:5929 length:1467 start_codon:yes stop_codon:yes gene_type:complete